MKNPKLFERIWFIFNGKPVTGMIHSIRPSGEVKIYRKAKVNSYRMKSQIFRSKKSALLYLVNQSYLDWKRAGSNYEKRCADLNREILK